MYLVEFNNHNHIHKSVLWWKIHQIGYTCALTLPIGRIIEKMVVLLGVLVDVSKDLSVNAI